MSISGGAFAFEDSGNRLRSRATEAGAAIQAGGAGAGVLDLVGAAFGAGEAVLEADDEFAGVGLDGGRAAHAVMRGHGGRFLVHGQFGDRLIQRFFFDLLDLLHGEFLLAGVPGLLASR